MMAQENKSRRRIPPLQIVPSVASEGTSSSSNFSRTDWRSDVEFRQSGGKRQPRTPNGLVLGDFVNIETKKKLLLKAEGDTKRRINPTSVSLSGPKFGVVVRDLANNTAFEKAEEKIRDNLSEIRESLRNEKQRMKESVLAVPLPRRSPQVFDNDVVFVLPSLTDVTDAEKISESAAKYASYLMEELPNFVTELSFLFDLLTSQTGSKVKHFIADPELLSSVHNCCYFAVCVLNSLRDFLSCLNISTLKLLLETGRIEAINPDFASFINDIHSRKLASVTESGNREENVPFSLETDAKSSFANEGAFRAFKKQRDLFYEVLRVWQEEHTKEDWDFAQVLGARVRGALNRRNGPVNGTHLVRLFCDQLIASCRNGMSFNHGSLDEDDIELLTFAKRMNPDKFRKLQERFFKPLTREALTSFSGFEGDEEFFRDFILISNDAYFLELLKCRLTKLILESDTFSLRTGDEELGTGNLELSEQQRFLDSLRTLRLLAKFLGLVTFAPFQCDKLPDSIAEELKMERCQIHPHWDLVAVLQAAFVGGHITLTVPWVIQFLTMVDPVTAKLRWYNVTVNYLSSLAQGYYLKCLRRNPFGPILIRLLVGWLLDQSHIEALCPIDLPEPPPPTLKTVDSLPFVDEIVIGICCPFLSSVNRPLAEFLVGNRVSAPTQLSRKITPITAVEDPSIKSGKTLQAELEDSFLYSQAPSTKRTIDFVSERLASNVVKQLKTGEIQTVMEGGVREIQKISLTDAERESKLLLITRLADSLSNQLRARSTIVSKQLIEDQASSVISALLPPDTSQQVGEVCSALVKKVAKDRVSVWMETNTASGYFYKELLALFESLEKNLGKQCQIKTIVKTDVALDIMMKHDLELKSPVEILTAMKDLTRDLLNDTAETTAEYLTSLVSGATEILGRRQEVSTTYVQCMWQLSFDLILSLVILQPSVVSSEVIFHFITYWETLKKEANLEAWVIFCPRQMMLLAQSEAPRQTWDKLYTLITRLLEAKLVGTNLLESQCVQLLKQDWPPELMQRFGTCMKDLSAFIIRNEKNLVRENDEETTGHFLDWISWYCGQTEPI